MDTFQYLWRLLKVLRWQRCRELSNLRFRHFEITTLLAGPLRLLGWLAARGRSEKAGRASGEMRRITFEEKDFFLFWSFAKRDVEDKF